MTPYDTEQDTQLMKRALAKIDLPRALLNAACFVILVAGMRASSAVLVPFLLALFITIITTPLFIGLRRTGMRSGFALLIIIFTLIVISFLAVRIAGNSLNEFSKNVRTYQQNLQHQRDKAVVWLKEHKVADPEAYVDRVFDPQVSMRYAGNLAATLSALLGSAMLILLIVVFMLLEIAILPKRIRSWPGMTREMWDHLIAITDKVRRYMGMKTFMSLLTGVSVGIWLTILQINHPVLLGMLAFMLNFVPSIGSIIASIPGIFLALVVFGPGYALICGTGYMVINIAISNVIEPRILGHGLGLSPLIILLSVIFWGWVLGPIGMLLSVPITMVVKIILENNESTLWMALLLGPASPALRLSSLDHPAATKDTQGEE